MATIVVTGRVGKDAELRHMQNNTAVLSFSIADDIGWGDKKTTQWIQCAMFGERAEKVAQFVTKGSIVEVAGIPSVEVWAKKSDNSPQAAIKVRVSELKLHGGGRVDTVTKNNNRPTEDDSEMPF